jgi:GNAT superfamily N-acetyltransferase
LVRNTAQEEPSRAVVRIESYGHTTQTSASRMDALKIEPAGVDDLQEMINRGNDEHWDQGVHDARLYFGVDPTGFWKCCSSDGSMLSSVSAVAYSSSRATSSVCYGFIGFYLVRPDLRGRGLGFPIFQHALRVLSDRGCLTIGLDAVPAQVKNYVKSGFTARYDNVRFSIPPDCDGRRTCAEAAASPPPHGVRLVPWDRLPFDSLQSLDARVFGACRSRALQGLMSYPGAVCVAAVDAAVLDAGFVVESGAIIAYGAVREACDDWRIGPLHVPVGSGEKKRAYEAALAVLHALVAAVPPQFAVVIDVPSTHAVATAALQDGLGAVVKERVVRMYTAGPPAGMDEGAVWGTSFLEIG